jgi:hypothetical protein
LVQASGPAKPGLGHSDRQIKEAPPASAKMLRITALAPHQKIAVAEAYHYRKKSQVGGFLIWLELYCDALRITERIQKSTDAPKPHFKKNSAPVLRARCDPTFRRMRY